jgi:hypothetical protein
LAPKHLAPKHLALCEEPDQVALDMFASSDQIHHPVDKRLKLVRIDQKIDGGSDRNQNVHHVSHEQRLALFGTSPPSAGRDGQCRTRPKRSAPARREMKSSNAGYAHPL